MLLADHGEGLGDHGELEHGLFLYDETIHVPMLIKLPGGESGGLRVAAPVQHVDVFPTLADLAGFTPPPNLHGRDLVPTLEGQGPPKAEGIYSEALYPRYHFGWSELESLTDERYKFIKAPREELYDLERDPHERTNLVADRAQAANAMRAGIDTLVAGRALDAPASVSAEDRERLAALGYVGSQFSTASSSGDGSSLPDPKDMAPVLKDYRAAIDLLDARKFAEGASGLRRILDDHPEMTDVWLQYAAVLLRLGRDVVALDALKHVVQLKPDEPSGLLSAAAVLMDLGRYDEARQYAELAVTRDAAAAHQMLANVALKQHDDAEARKQAKLAADANPTLPMPAYVEGMIQYDAGHYDRALAPLMQARDAWSKRTLQVMSLRFYIADALARLGRDAEAERYFGEELSLFPTNVRARSGIAMLYQSTGRPDAAGRAIDEMIAASPAPLTYNRAVQLWTMFGRPDKAAEVAAAAKQKFGR